MARDMSATEGMELTWIVDEDPDALSRARVNHPLVSTSSEIGAALKSVDAVAVCANARAHFDLALAALEAGCHVMVEKPMSLVAEQAAALLEGARRRSLTLAVGHQMLHHPVFLRMREELFLGTIGHLESMRFERAGRVDLESEPDVVWAFGPHDLAMAISLAGEEPPRLTLGDHDRNRVGAMTRASFNLDFRGGVGATVELDGAAEERRRLVTVVGDGGAMVFDDSIPGGRLQVLSVSGESLWHFEGSDPGAPLRRACDDFAGSIRRGTVPVASGLLGLAVTELLERLLADGA